MSLFMKREEAMGWAGLAWVRVDGLGMRYQLGIEKDSCS